MSIQETSSSSISANNECGKRAANSCEVGKFSVPLNGQKLDEQLKTFENVCREYAKHYHRRCRKRYYRLGVMALLEKDTTSIEIQRLLKHGVRTFLVDLFTYNEMELQNLVQLFTEAEEIIQKNIIYNRLITSVAVQISADNVRIGRFRNNCAVFLQCNDIITLTTDTSYRYSCYKQISYCVNLNYYLPKLNLFDEFQLGTQGARGKIVKLLPRSCAIIITNGGHLYSYDYIQLPCTALSRDMYEELLEDDLLTAKVLGAHYIMLPNIRCRQLMAYVKKYMAEHKSLSWKLIGSLDLGYVQKHTNDLLSFLKLLDYLYLPQLFLSQLQLQKYILDDVIPMTRCLKRPIIGLVPIEDCCDFSLYENHSYLWKLDTLFIQKSRSARKYPLIATKLLPIRNFRIAMVENALAIKKLKANYPSIVNFLIRTISSIECQAVLLHSKCKDAAISLARMEIYCPVFVILPIDQTGSNEECIVQLARNYHLRRNLYPLIYTTNMNNCAFQPIEYGLDLLRRSGVLEVGDFVVTMELKQQEEHELVNGVGDDIVIMRAFYVPPKPIANKFMYA